MANAAFVPPPPLDMVQALGDWEKFLHFAEDIPFLIKVGLAHAQFETIHPFLDGNGRICRLMITFLMCERQIVKRPLLYLSHFFKQNRDEYYTRLQAIRDTGDWENWLKFFLVGVAQVAHEATETARKIVALREKHRGRVAAELGRSAAKGLELLELLYFDPVVTVKSIAPLLGLSFANTNSLITKFTKLGLLKEATGQQRNRVFTYSSYLDLF